jgi:GTPase
LKPISKNLISTDPPVEKAFLVGVELKHEHSGWGIEDSLEELSQLAGTAQLEVVGQIYQRLERVDPATYVHKGKLEEIQTYLNELNFDVLTFDDELLPRQQRNIEEALGIRVLDRSALILDIFAQHARTKEGSMQVELAQYEYLLPRLTGQWHHLGRQTSGGRGGAGGMGTGLRGPGETQLETDRREVRRRISQLKENLEEVRRQRSQHRTQRRQTGIPTVALVGYTNAGKSTLLNALSGADVYTADQLFATLDPTTRRITLPSGMEALLTDTVGFIKKLPTTLVAAFRATLEEIIEADVLIHVIDITHPRALEQSLAVEATLTELGARDKPTVIALNKIDRFEESDDRAPLAEVLADFPHSLAVSAVAGTGLDQLLSRVQQVLQQEMVPVRLRLPYRAAELLALFHQQGNVTWEEHTQDGTNVEGFLPERLLDAYQSYFVTRFNHRKK